MTLKTTIKHLRALCLRQEDMAVANPGSVPTTKAERKALTEAIAWLAGERRREIRADLRGKVIDHVDGNLRNMTPSNLRITTMAENTSNHVPPGSKERRVPSIIISGDPR